MAIRSCISVLLVHIRTTTRSTQPAFEAWRNYGHPIKTEADYQAALAEVERLFDAPPDTPEGDRLDILTTLIEAYKAQTAPIAAPDPIEAILYHLESRGLARRDLESYVGGRARVSEILNRKCPLTLEM